MYLRYAIILAIALAAIDQCTGASVMKIELSSGWSLKNQDGSKTASGLSVPSGVYSALYGEDVLLSYNDINMRWIGYENWTYTNHFSLNKYDYESVKYVYATFHGVDTISTIYLNGHEIGTTDNMFVRYSFDVRPYLQEENILEVAFESPILAAKAIADELMEQGKGVPPYCPEESYKGICHMNMLRKLQASFSWDWGPAVPSTGIWKPIYLEFHEVGVMRSIDVATSKNRTHWVMDIRVFLDTDVKQTFYGEVTLYAAGLLDGPMKVSRQTISYKNPVIKFLVAVRREDVTMWWPNGYGQQKLYPLHFALNTWVDDNGPATQHRTISEKTISVGFRTVELVQDKLDDGNAFYFKVNDVPIFIKGNNMIPIHILPEFSADEDRIEHLLKSAQDAHTNMIRIWGGSYYESDYFYHVADKLGILIWHDMLFACAMYPAYDSFLESVRTEVNQNVLRVVYHASAAIFATNNENEVALVHNWYGTESDRERFEDEYRKLYVETINDELKIIAHHSRPEILISSPSNGVKNAEDNHISDNPQSNYYGDVHFYDIEKDTWDPNIYPRSRFVSEYGFQSLSNTGSWNRVLGENDNIKDLIVHRQHHVSGMAATTNLFERHLPVPENDYNMEASIYFSQIAQAMSLKAETVLYRSLRDTNHHTMGALYWQLNDVWVAPSWSSIDFDGNWKIVHNWLTEFMAPIIIGALYDSETNSVNVNLIRDTIDDAVMDVEVTMNVHNWSKLQPRLSVSWPAQLKPNSAQLNKVIPIEHIFWSGFTTKNSFVEFELKEQNNVISRTFYFPTSIKLAEGISDPELQLEIKSKYCVDAKNIYNIAVKVNRPAVFVYIEVISSNINQYRLSENGFMQTTPVKMITLEFTNKRCVNLELHDFKIQTVNQYM